MCCLPQAVAAWQAAGLCHGDIKPGNIAVETTTLGRPVVSVLDIEGSVSLLQARDVTLKWPVPVGGAAAAGVTGARARTGDIGAKIAHSLSTSPPSEGTLPPSAGVISSAPPKPNEVTVFTRGFARPSAVSGVVLAEATTDWFSLGHTLQWLATKLRRVRAELCVQRLQIHGSRCTVASAVDLCRRLASLRKSPRRSHGWQRV